MIKSRRLGISLIAAISTVLSGVIPSVYANTSVGITKWSTSSRCLNGFPYSYVTIKNYMASTYANLKIVDSPIDPIGADFVSLAPGEEKSFPVDLSESGSIDVLILWEKNGSYSDQIGHKVYSKYYCY